MSAADRAATELGQEAFSGDPVMLLRAHRALHVLVGGSLANMRHFMATENRHLGGVPSNLVQTPEGLQALVAYLEAMCHCT